MIIPRVWTDEQGASHFADLDLPEAMAPMATGLPEMRATSSMPAESFRLITTTPQAMARGWHPAPARRFVIVVRGAIDVEVSDGETRRLNAGSMIFFEDVVGRGHLNRIVDDQEIMLAFLVVPEHWSAVAPVQNLELCTAGDGWHPQLFPLLLFGNMLKSGNASGSE